LPRELRKEFELELANERRQKDTSSRIMKLHGTLGKQEFSVQAVIRNKAGDIACG
jgi:hypothetical protein